MVLFQHTHNITKTQSYENTRLERWSKFTVNMALARLHHTHSIYIPCIFRYLFFFGSFFFLFRFVSLSLFFNCCILFSIFLSFSFSSHFHREPVLAVYLCICVSVCAEIMAKRETESESGKIEDWKGRTRTREKKAITRRKMNGKLELL